MNPLVFIVSAYWDYEGSTPVMAFLTAAAAEKFKEKCNKYAGRKKPCPAVLDTPENDAEWETWHKWESSWTRKHPAGADNSSADSFGIVTVPLMDK